MTETSRQRRQRETRAALLASAYELFSSRGYAETSLDQVAAQAGYTKGAVYGLFSSKEDLFLALVEEQSDEAVGELSEALPESASPEVVLHAMGQFLARYLRERRGWALVNTEFAVLSVRKPGLADRRLADINRTLSRIASLLDRVRPGQDNTALARIVTGVMDGLALHGAIDPTVDVAADFSLALERLVFADQREVIS